MDLTWRHLDPYACGDSRGGRVTSWIALWVNVPPCLQLKVSKTAKKWGQKDQRSEFNPNDIWYMFVVFTGDMVCLQENGDEWLPLFVQAANGSKMIIRTKTNGGSLVSTVPSSCILFCGLNRLLRGSGRCFSGGFKDVFEPENGFKKYQKLSGVCCWKVHTLIGKRILFFINDNVMPSERNNTNNIIKNDNNAIRQMDFI